MSSDPMHAEATLGQGGEWELAAPMPPWDPEACAAVNCSGVADPVIGVGLCATGAST